MNISTGAPAPVAPAEWLRRALVSAMLCVEYLASLATWRVAYGYGYAGPPSPMWNAESPTEASVAALADELQRLRDAIPKVRPLYPARKRLVGIARVRSIGYHFAVAKLGRRVLRDADTAVNSLLIDFPKSRTKIPIAELAYTAEAVRNRKGRIIRPAEQKLLAWRDFRLYEFLSLWLEPFDKDEAQDKLMQEYDYAEKQLHKRTGGKGKREVAGLGDGAKTKHGLKPSEEKAFAQYKRTVELNSAMDGARDRDIYDYVKKHLLEEDESLPEFDTWQRQLRAARKCHKAQKNTPRTGRHSRSIVKQSDV